MFQQPRKHFQNTGGDISVCKLDLNFFSLRITQLILLNSCSNWEVNQTGSVLVGSQEDASPYMWVQSYTQVMFCRREEEGNV